MHWGLWQPWYEHATKELGIDEKADRMAARILNDLLPAPKISELKKIVEGKECIVLGAGPSLEIDLEKLERSDLLEKVLISADGATSAVIEYCEPEVIVTDLDGDVKDQLEAWRKGSWLVVHGHGDNITRIRNFVPKIDKRIIGTTQVKAFGKLYNFGGFTDGDRAAFMARELGASKIYLAGMDLGTEIGRRSGSKDLKRKLTKLGICKELLSWLAGELGAPMVNLTSQGEPIKNVPHEALP